MHIPIFQSKIESSVDFFELQWYEQDVNIEKIAFLSFEAGLLQKSGEKKAQEYKLNEHFYRVFFFSNFRSLETSLGAH